MALSPIEPHLLPWFLLHSALQAVTANWPQSGRSSLSFGLGNHQGPYYQPWVWISQVSLNCISLKLLPGLFFSQESMEEATTQGKRVVSLRHCTRILPHPARSSWVGEGFASPGFEGASKGEKKCIIWAFIWLVWLFCFSLLCWVLYIVSQTGLCFSLCGPGYPAFLSAGIISMNYPSQPTIQSRANIKEGRFQQEEHRSFKVLVYMCWQGSEEVRVSQHLPSSWEVLEGWCSIELRSRLETCGNSQQTGSLPSPLSTREPASLFQEV